MKGLTANHKTEKVNENGEVHEITTGEATINITNRLMRKPGLADRTGVVGIIDQLEIAPIPQGAIIPIASSIMRASRLDGERIRLKIPLMYIWLEAFLLGQKGAKGHRMIIRDLATTKLQGESEEPAGGENAE